MIDSENPEDKDPVEFANPAAIARMSRKPDFTVTEAKVDYYGKTFLSINWATVSAGHGQLMLRQTKDGIHIFSECMGKDFVKEVLSKLVDDSKLME